MTYNIPRVVIAGLKGGSGKTTLSIGLTKAVRDRGLTVATFKKGPDYIDAGWLACASGRDCFNLDPYLIPQEKILLSFAIHSHQADISIIEGNRGLFDGMDVSGTYSTSELAKMLKAPVILVVDCTKATRTVAAVIKGITGFDGALNVMGGVLNYIGGVRHETVVRGAIERYTSVEVLGSLHRIEKDLMPERHMGLTPYQEHRDVGSAIDKIGDIVREHVDVDRLLEMARVDEGIAPTGSLYGDGRPDDEGLTIGVIQDMAFQFYYPDNLDALTAGGARIKLIDAMKEKELSGLDALYIGGGFPETNAPGLSANRALMKSLKGEVERGLPVYAECGGLMYLGRKIILDGNVYPMTDVLPLSFKIEKRPVAHGYTMLEVAGDNPYYPVETVLKGHEFHYSGVAENDQPVRMVFRMKKGKGIGRGMDGVVYKNVLATYTHVHALGCPEWAPGLLDAAKRHKKGK